MMKKTLLLLLILVAGTVNAQYFYSHKGASLIYKTTSLENKTKEVTMDTARITEVYTSGDTLVAHYSYPQNSDSESQIFKFTKDGITRVYLDTEGMLNEILKDAVNEVLNESEDKAQIDRNALMGLMKKQCSLKGNIFSTLDPKVPKGEKLPKSHFTIDGNIVRVLAAQKEVMEGFETVTTPAGTFKCIKISSRTAHKVASEPSENDYETSWYAENIGLVKQVVTTKKGKVLSSTVLVEKKI